MREIELNRFASVRVWEGELPDANYRGEVARKIVGEAEVELVSPRRVCVEVFVPRGGMGEYGLLGGHLQPDTTGRLVLEVVRGQRAGGSTFQSLAKDVDDVHVGLPDEFAVAVLNTTLMPKRLPSGVIRIDWAAHGLVGSSPQIFEKLASVLLALLCGDEPSDDELRRRFLG